MNERRWAEIAADRINLASAGTHVSAGTHAGNHAALSISRTCSARLTLVTLLVGKLFYMND